LPWLAVSENSRVDMELSYYPGCTIKTRARNFEDSAMAVIHELGVNMVGLPRWNCCGTVYSLADDDLVHHVASVRNLMHVRKQGHEKVVTLCAFCYNTLHRANEIMRDNVDKRFAINSFMDEEAAYEGQVSVSHLLQVLRDDIGLEKISARVTKPLDGMKVASYYGCTLLRPQSAAIDSPENPTVLQNLVKALGGTPIDFPFATECCGSFQVVDNRDFVSERAYEIINSARKNGAEVILVSCPLCEFNLRQAQVKLKQKYADFNGLAILYFTQLMALAFGLDINVNDFELNSTETREWLRNRKLVT
jgi:heterodisulfide reductase subunit B